MHAPNNIIGGGCDGCVLLRAQLRDSAKNQGSRERGDLCWLSKHPELLNLLTSFLPTPRSMRT